MTEEEYKRLFIQSLGSGLLPPSPSPGGLLAAFGNAANPHGLMARSAAGSGEPIRESPHIPLFGEMLGIPTWKDANRSFQSARALKRPGVNPQAAQSETQQGRDIVASIFQGFGTDAGPGMMGVVKMYHGTPYKFDAFDMSKIGTGEGAQAYGHGLYFAENPGVAKAYRDQLSQNKLGSIADVLPEYFKPGNIVPSWGGRDKVLEFHRGNQPWDFSVKVQKIDSGGNLVDRPRWHQTPPSQEQVKQVLGRGMGHFLTVEHPANPEDFLHWDKPLSEQSEKVQQILKKFGIDRADWTGAQIYESSKLVPGQYRDKSAAAAALREAGVPASASWIKGVEARAKAPTTTSSSTTSR